MFRVLGKSHSPEARGSGGAPQPAESTADASQLGGLPTVRLRAAASPAPEIPGRLGAPRAGFATGNAQCGSRTAGKKWFQCMPRPVHGFVVVALLMFCDVFFKCFFYVATGF